MNFLCKIVGRNFVQEIQDSLDISEKESKTLNFLDENLISGDVYWLNLVRKTKKMNLRYGFPLTPVHLH